MSTIWDDTMRAAIFCNVTGMPPETDAQRAARLKGEEEHRKVREGLCPESLEFYDDDLSCDLPNGHEGVHSHHWADDGVEVRW
jgi:hypothetical protein